MKRSSSLLLCLILATLCSLVALPASAQVAEVSHRLKKLYDFEDTDDRGNKIGFRENLLPRNWYVIGRKAIGETERFHEIPLNHSLESRLGYPSFAEVAFDHTVKHSGDFSLKLSMSGGNTGAFVQQGAVNVKPESDYRVTAKVYTDKLEHAWAEMRAYFVDRDGQPIAASIKRSEPMTTKGEWMDASIKLIGDYPDAASIGIELHILQPGLDYDDPIGLNQVVPADIHGGAWFDDVAVWELPSVSIKTDTRTNVIQAPTKPTLRARVRDLTGRRLYSSTTVYNHRLEVVDSDEDAVEEESWSWTPDLGDRYGWYWADLEIFEVNSNNQKRTQVARTLAGFLWLPPGQSAAGDDRARFKLLAEDVPNGHLPLIAELMEQSGLTSLLVSGWERGSTPETTAERAQILEPIARDLIVQRGEMVVSLWPIPVELAAQADVDLGDPLDLLSQPNDLWQDYAKPFLSPLGQRLNLWQVGSSSNPQAFLARDLKADLEAARRGVRLLAPSPRFVAPWRLDQPSRDGDLSPFDRYAVAWPQGIVPERLADAMADWPTPPDRVRLDIELADAIDMVHERRIADLMLRVLHAWEHDVAWIGINKPWTDAYERHTALTPDPVLGVWINLTRQLEGQRVIGRMPLGPGLKAMILDGQQGGMVLVWNEKADAEPAEVSLYLGESPVVVDPFGNVTPLETTDGKQTLSVGQTPTIIRNIDPRLALFRAGFVLDDPFVQSLQIAHRRTLKVHNPWPRTLNGPFTFMGPDKWTVQPQRKHLSIAPGDTAEVPIAMRFPIHENGGYKALTADFVFNVGDDYNVTLTTPMELGLEGVSFDAAVIAEPGKTPGTIDAIVTLTITNTADRRQSLNIFAGLAGHARRELIIPGIAPGEFVSRRIRFRDVGDQIGKFPLRCGVRESNGPAVLNKTIDLLPPRKADDPPAGIAEVPAE
ncbi:MAG: hypothetical protein AAGB26_01055 [Planctomycetota bacterium]